MLARAPGAARRTYVSKEEAATMTSPTRRVSDETLAELLVHLPANVRDRSWHSNFSWYSALVFDLRDERADNVKNRARIVELEDRQAEIQMNSYKWMKAHDAILSFVQCNPLRWKDFQASGLSIEYPKPENVPDALVRVVELERQLAESVELQAAFRHNNDASKAIEQNVRERLDRLSHASRTAQPTATPRRKSDAPRKY
jgi:hypothetical protein